MINSTKISNEFREKIKKSVPSDFDLTQIGKIDLREAEQIAREEVIFLKEEDLIEGLEEFELIPLKEVVEIQEEQPSVKITTKQKVKPQEKDDESFSEGLDEDILIFDDNIPEEGFSVKKAADKQVTVLKPDDIHEIEEEKEIFISDTEEKEASADIEDSVISENHDIIQAQDIEPENTNKLKEVPEAVSEYESQMTDEQYNASEIPDLHQIDEVFEDEFLPEKYSDIAKKGNVVFIDDRHISKESDFTIPSDEDQLTTRLAKMIDITKGKPRIVEADADFFKNRYTLEHPRTYVYDDEVLYEEKFITDTDFDFIDNSIIKEDFIQYIQEIDDYYSIEAEYSQSEISEIMGLTRDEEKFYEDMLFGEYFNSIDIDSEIEFINPGLDFFSTSSSDKKDMIYLLDNPDSLKPDEKNSIEADVSSESAIVFEESIRDIEQMLGETPEPVIPEKEFRKEMAEPQAEYKPENVIFEDITDKVILLDDLDNMNEFMETVPDKKEDLTKLLAYLDGLFEKLPEEAVRKFAESEYYDLYVKVMKDMGI